MKNKIFMMRKAKSNMIAALALLLAGSLFGAPTTTREEADQAADAIFNKEATFSQTLQAARPKYQKWRQMENDFFQKSGIKFGTFKRGKQEDGNPIHTMDIDSPKDITVGVTLRIPTYSVVLLNGEQLAENTHHDPTHEPQIVTLKLKRGKNTLELKNVTYHRNYKHDEFFRLGADPNRAIKDRFWREFGKHISIGNKNFEYSMLTNNNNRDLFRPLIQQAIERSLYSAGKFEKAFQKMMADNIDPKSTAWIELFDEIVTTRDLEHSFGYNIQNLRAALEDIYKKNPGKFDRKYAEELKKWEAQMPAMIDAFKKGERNQNGKIDAFKKFAREALLANPLVQKNNDWIYLVRKPGAPYDGLPSNWQGNSLMRDRQRWGDEIWSLKLTDPDSAKPLFADPNHPAITDLEVDWDGKHIMFSGLDEKNRWQLYEIDSNGKNVKMLTPGIHESVDSFDSVYLPNGKIIFCYTACWVGVPCVGGADYVANLYIMDPKAGSPEKVDKSIRQLTFEQDADWMPTVMNDGRVMYTRWEYTDNSHYFSRILMRMNPDGTSQSAYYGSTSYWPNSIFYSRPIADDATKFVSIVSGHHGTRRSGELHLFDTSKGTIEEQGRVHKFPSFGREYVAETKDQLVDGKWPQIIHPYPLSEDLMLVSMRTPDHNFRIYLIDKFDNMTEIAKPQKNEMLFQPMPLAARPKPRVIPDQVTPKLKANPKLDTGNLFLNDIYQGPGLAGVPRGEVKALRIFEYNYAYRNMGSHDVIGQEGSWDVKRLWGTVPVEEDGSAMFEVPANRPLALQPLDKDGKALALMRSWLTVMPGETQSCVGCHEGQGMTPISGAAMAARKAPSKITPFRAPVRGFSFDRDVQPTIDKFCVGCHDGTNPDRPNLKKGERPAWKHFSNAYMALHPFVRRSGPESYQNLLPTAEFTANTSELVQMLQKGHHGVELDKEAWENLYTWIDMNVPYIGSWKEVRKDIPNNGDKERMKYLALYANRFEDQDEITWFPQPQTFVKPKPAPKHADKEPTVAGWPFDAKAAANKVASAGLPKELLMDIGDGTSIRFTLIPAGAYVRGTNDGFYDEGPAHVAKIEKPFYMAQFEITNKQFSAFDKNHNSGHLDMHWKDHVGRGYKAHLPEQPVIRVSWKKAKEFADWLAKNHGLEVNLPSEAQWEWAARAGSHRDFWFGNIGDDFSAFENFSDVTTKKFAVTGVDPQPIRNPSPQMAFVPADLEFDDGELVSANVGTYVANPFNLFDMQGNVAEWTLDTFTKTLGGEAVEGNRTVRGGSWRDRTKWARITMRRNYPEWQGVYNVGIRIVINDAQKAAEVLKPAKPLPEKKPNFRKAEDDSNFKDLTPYRTNNPKDLIANGGFEYPEVPEGVNMISREDVPAWNTSAGRFEFWREGVVGSPTTDSAGVPTGQHLEIAEGGSGPFEVWQSFKIPETVKNTSARLTFEAWPREIKNNAEAIVYVNGKLKARKKFAGAQGKWTKNILDVSNLFGGDNVKILFREEGSSAGWHIDSVTFVIK